MSRTNPGAEERAYLEGLGLTPVEAKVYLALLSIGEAKASFLAREAEILRTDIYRILSALTGKGLVSSPLGTPAKYTATDPQEALGRLIKDQSSKTQRLTAQYARMVSRIKSMSKRSNTHTGEFKVLPNRYRGFETAVEMITRSQSYYAAVFSKWGLARYCVGDGPGRKALATAHRRGVSIRIISEIDKSNYAQASVLSKFAEVRHTSDVTFFLDLSDGKEVILGPKLIPHDLLRTRQEVDLWTNNPAFVNAIQGMFDKLWHSSVPYHVRKNIVKKKPA